MQAEIQTNTLSGGFHIVFLALAFDLDRRLELFGLRRLEGLRSCKASVRASAGSGSASDDSEGSEDSNQARRVYAPLLAQHHLENALGAYSANDFFAVYAAGRQMCAPIVTSKAERSASLAMLS